MVKKYCAEP